MSFPQFEEFSQRVHELAEMEFPVYEDVSEEPVPAAGSDSNGSLEVSEAELQRPTRSKPAVKKDATKKIRRECSNLLPVVDLLRSENLFFVLMSKMTYKKFNVKPTSGSKSLYFPHLWYEGKLDGDKVLDWDFKVFDMVVNQHRATAGNSATVEQLLAGISPSVDSLLDMYKKFKRSKSKNASCLIRMDE